MGKSVSVRSYCRRGRRMANNDMRPRVLLAQLYLVLHIALMLMPWNACPTRAGCAVGCGCAAPPALSGWPKTGCFSSRSEYSTVKSFCAFSHISGSQYEYLPCSPPAIFAEIWVPLSLVIHRRKSLWYRQLRLNLTGGFVNTHQPKNRERAHSSCAAIS